MRKDVIVVGASAGGLDAISQLLGALPKDLPASIFVVLHLHPDHSSMMAGILRKRTKLDVVTAKDRAALRHGRVYVAPPNRHLVLESRRIRVIKGPRENLHRPAIDPLFRSAAYYFGPRVIGVLLTGGDSDGTSGLFSIKMKRGTTIVQDPQEASHPMMPMTALNHLAVDHVVTLGEMPPLLELLTDGRGA